LAASFSKKGKGKSVGKPDAPVKVKMFFALFLECRPYSIDARPAKTTHSPGNIIFEGLKIVHRRTNQSGIVVPRWIQYSSRVRHRPRRDTY
jgi:hypothetical protein